MDNANNNSITSNTHVLRSPVFNTDEVSVLLNSIEKYKSIVLNKAINSVSNFAKDKAWAKIAKLHNSHNFKHVRTPEVLKTKWLNLKRNARKVPLNEMDSEFTQFDKNMIHVAQLVREMDCSAAPIGSVDDAFPELSDEDKDETNDTDNKYCQEDTSLYDSVNETESESRSRNSNFSPQECNLLMKCINQHRKLIFAKNTNKIMWEKKNAAWIRVTNKFNESSPNKRSMRALKTKFENMKRRYTKFSSDENNDQPTHEIEVEIKPIKTEFFETEMDDSNIDDVEENIQNGLEKSPPYNNDDSMDPLKFVMNSGSGDCNPWNEFENKEVVELKLKLLNYQLETEKLKRRKLEEEIKADQEERKNRALETALRLRKARIELVEAELKLPSSHPALVFTDKEEIAEEYLKNM